MNKKRFGKIPWRIEAVRKKEIPLENVAKGT